MTRGLAYLEPRPACDFPAFVPAPPRRMKPGRTVKVPLSSRRSTSDKTGEATRRRIREVLVKKWGAVCHICWAAGITDQRAIIDLTLRWPDPGCFTRDHIKPRSLGGRDYLSNQRPAHKLCNEKRGNKPLTQKEDA